MGGRVLLAVGLIRPSKRGGFCPACRVFRSGASPHELAPPGLISLALLIIAGAAWAVTLARSSAMDDMDMGLGSFGTFLASWTVMLVAMMLPSAAPLVFEFARTAEGRRGWKTATALLALTYLGVWLACGGVCYVLYNVMGMPWSKPERIAGAALVLAGLYAFTPVKRACAAWCRQLRALRGPLPFNLMRSALVAGFRYGVSCVGCNIGLMLALVLIGMANVLWMIVLSGIMLTYKLAPASTLRWGEPALSAALVALGVVYALGV